MYCYASVTLVKTVIITVLTRVTLFITPPLSAHFCGPKSDSYRGKGGELGVGVGGGVGRRAGGGGRQGEGELMHQKGSLQKE